MKFASVRVQIRGREFAYGMRTEKRGLEADFYIRSRDKLRAARNLAKFPSPSSVRLLSRGSGGPITARQLKSSKIAGLENPLLFALQKSNKIHR